MEHVGAAWGGFVAAAWQADKITVLGVSPFTLLVAANNAYLLRLALRFRMHWLRVFLTLMVLTTGGGTLAHMLLARPAAWATPGSAVVPSVAAAFYLFFHCPGDLAYRGFRLRALRDLWQLVSSAQIAFGASAGVELAVGLPLATRLLLGVLAAVGGGFIAEALDLLLQGHTRYRQPHGLAPGAVLAVGGAAAYATLLRGPLAPLDLPVAQARAALFLAIAAVNYGVSGKALQLGANALLSLLPGARPVWPGGDAAAEDATLDADARPPWPLDRGLFGYAVPTLRELGGASQASAVSGVKVSEAATENGSRSAPAAARTPSSTSRKTGRGKRE